MEMVNEILELKTRYNALILAHNYTRPEIQDIADFVGDSLELSRKAAECHAPVIVFCGVRFMAETAKLLSPDSIVLHPNPKAGCPMAEMASPEEIRAYRAEHPDTMVVAYVNTTAATKTEVDICCTSGNAENLVASLPSDRRLLFLPDANLGANIAAKLGRKIELWPGCCPTHNKILPEHITEARQRHPDAIVLVHPECLPAVVALADHALSTGGMLRFVHESPQKEFIIGTEGGILHRMRKENPDKVFYPLEPAVLCPNMKRITLEDVLNSLRDMSPTVELTEEVLRRARDPIDKMLEVH
ncbi:MAG: quinolinate synthase NadA [Victivallales bacterium]|nr:quinolinate synthase NadA [Victivallales bacterium]